MTNINVTLAALESANDEVHELRAEIEQLKAELARIRGLPRLAALDDEIERLRAALQEIEALDDRIISEAGKIMRAISIARRALEHKP